MMDNQYHIFSFIKIWKSIISNLKNNYELCRQLVLISLTEQFKKTILGNAWLIIDPLLTIVIWLLLNSSGLFNPGDTNIPYPAFLLLSITLWTFFVGFFNTIGPSISEAGRMLIEATFPIEIKVVEKIILNIINFIIPFVITIIVLVIVGVDFNLYSLLFFPSLIPLILFGISIGLLFSLFEVIFFDIYILVKRSLRLLMYLTPIVYSPKINNGILSTIAKHNPLTYLVGIPRDILTGSPTDFNEFWIYSICSVLVFLITVQFYYISQKKIIEKILD